jgi:hypothetical protein
MLGFVDFHEYEYEYNFEDFFMDTVIKKENSASPIYNK